MIRILLACAGGFSTSMLVERMIEAARNESEEILIEATAEGRVEKVVNQVDVLMLGPQVGHLEKKFQEKYTDKAVKITTIPSLDYGMMNGEKVLQQALELHKQLQGGV